MLEYVNVRRTSDRNASEMSDRKVRRSIGSSKNIKKSSKKCLTKNRFCGKIIKLSAARLRRLQDLEN